MIEYNGLIISKFLKKDSDGESYYFYKLLLVVDAEEEITKELWARSDKNYSLLKDCIVEVTINPYNFKAKVNNIIVD